MKNKSTTPLTYLPGNSRRPVGLFVLMLSLFTLAPADMIFFDSLSGLSTANLNGTAPATRPGTETWSASTDIKADGSYTPPASGSAHNRSGYLPFSLQAAGPNIYRLSVLVNSVQNINSSIGFTKTSTLTGTASNTFSTYLRLTGVGTSGGNVTAVGSGFTTTDIGTFVYGTDYTLNLEIDTRAETWTASFWIDDNAPQTFSLANAVKAEIIGVGLHVTKADAAFAEGTQVLFDDFTLAVIPEPGTVMLMGIGFVAILLGKFIKR
jgi:hypothetical protein